MQQTQPGDVSGLIQHAGTAVPDAFELSQNYPNPFNPETHINFNLPEAATVKLVVLDMLGREITTLKEGNASAGYHSVTWKGIDASGQHLSSGLYFYRLSAVGASGQTFTKTMKSLMTK